MQFELSEKSYVINKIWNIFCLENFESNLKQNLRSLDEKQLKEMQIFWEIMLYKNKFFAFFHINLKWKMKKKHCKNEAKNT